MPRDTLEMFTSSEPETKTAPAKLSRQDVFDKVCVHLRSMPRRSTKTKIREVDSYYYPNHNYDWGTMCAYRSKEDDLKCAFGIFIPDNMYKEEMENIKAGTLVHTRTELFEMFDFTSTEKDKVMENHSFFNGLQAIHDNATNWRNGKMPMRYELEKFAIHWGLSSEVLDRVW